MTRMFSSDSNAALLGRTVWTSQPSLRMALNSALGACHNSKTLYSGLPYSCSLSTADSTCACTQLCLHLHYHVIHRLCASQQSVLHDPYYFQAAPNQCCMLQITSSSTLPLFD